MDTITKVTFLFLMVYLCLGTPLTLHDGNSIVFNSSMVRDAISISLSSNGKLNSSFHVQSELLSPLMNRYEIIHGPEKILTDPVLDEDVINFNDFDGSQYWLAFKHKIKHAEPKDVNFVGLRLIDGEHIYDYILPSFPQPFSFLPLGSLYKCDQVLVSIIVSQKGLDVALFSKKSQNVTWLSEQGKWNWEFRRENAQFDFGRQTRRDKQQPVRITLSHGNFCQIDPNTLLRANNQKLIKSRYLKFQQVLANASTLILQQINSQL